MEYDFTKADIIPDQILYRFETRAVAFYKLEIYIHYETFLLHIKLMHLLPSV